MTGSMLAARSLGFGYGSKIIGRDAHIDVKPGEVLCLLGPNGSGKTTLFKTVLGLLPPLTGEVLLGGRPMTQLVRQEIARLVAYVPQAHAAHFPFRVVDMVLMGRTAHLGLFAAPTRQDRAKALEALATLGIAELAETEYTRISGGQRQLALVARALAQDAPAIVMDEPTASLDFGNQVTVLSVIKRLAGRGLAVLLSTHDPDHAFSVGTRVALLSDGRIVVQGTPDEVLTPDRLHQVYGVRVIVERLSHGQPVCAPDFSANRRRVTATFRLLLVAGSVGGLARQRCLERPDVRGRCGGSRTFDRTIASDHIAAERGQARAAAAGAAHLLLHERLAEDVVDLVDQEPGAPVGHAHLLAGGDDRSVLRDQFHQGDLARARGIRRRRNRHGS